MKSNIFFFLVLCFINACAPPSFMDYSKLGLFDKGLSKSDFISQNTTDIIYEYKINNSSFKENIYVYIFKDVKFMNGDAVPDFSFYEYDAFVFYDDKLEIWGSVDDLKRNKDKQIRDIGYLIAQEIKREIIK